MAYPCYFRLTEDAIVTDFGAIKTGTGAYAKVLER
jgi:hypothetical protein